MGDKSGNPQDNEDVIVCLDTMQREGGEHTVNNTMSDDDALSSERRAMQVRTLSNVLVALFSCLNSQLQSKLHNRRCGTSTTVPINHLGLMARRTRKHRGNVVGDLPLDDISVFMLLGMMTEWFLMLMQHLDARLCTITRSHLGIGKGRDGQPETHRADALRFRRNPLHSLYGITILRP